MSMNLSILAGAHSSQLAAFSEEGPGCGTHPPGWHPPWPPQPHAEMSLQSAINPQPLPPRDDAMSLSGATRLDGDDTPLCPPPRPHPWLDSVAPANFQVLNALGVSGSQTPAQSLQDAGIIIVGG